MTISQNKPHNMSFGPGAFDHLTLMLLYGFFFWNREYSQGSEKNLNVSKQWLSFLG